MNAPSPWLRPLTAIALVLAVVDIGLLLAWWQRTPALPALEASEAPRASAPAPSIQAEAVRGEATDADAAGTPQAVETADAASAALYGAFARSDGTPIPSGVLWLYRDGTHVGTASPTDGVYAFAGLRTGDYRIASRVDDALPLDRTVHVEAPRTRLDLLLDPSWPLQVHAVTPDGKPLVEALTAIDPGFARMRTLVAAAFAEPLQGDLPLSDSAAIEAGLGTFRRNDAFRGETMAKQTVGVLTIPTGAPVHVALLMRSVLLAQQSVAPDQPEVTFVVDPAQLLQRTARVSLRVVDEQGAPAAGCQVALNDQQTGGGGLKSGADGRVVLEHLAPGRLALSIGYERSGPPIAIDVQPGADLDLGDVVTQPRVDVAFVGDFGGEGSVRLTWLDAPLLPGRSVKSTYLSAQNGATIRAGLFPGRYAALATSKGRGSLFVFDTNSLPSEPLRIDLQPSAPLRIRGGGRGQSIEFELRADNGAIAWRDRRKGTVDVTHMLPLGTYLVTTFDDNGVGTPRSVPLPREGAVVDLR